MGHFGTETIHSLIDCLPLSIAFGTLNRTKIMFILVYREFHPLEEKIHFGGDNTARSF